MRSFQDVYNSPKNLWAIHMRYKKVRHCHVCIHISHIYNSNISRSYILKVKRKSEYF